MKSKDLIIIGGPTGVGKSSVAIELAKSLGGEVVSADSVQVYRGLDIGSGKVKPQDQARAPHHLIDICQPDEDYNVALYMKDARQAIGEIFARGRVPIACGGTGLYLQSLVYDLDFSKQEPKPGLRRELEEIEKREGAQGLYDLLKDLDPDSAKATDRDNPRRLIRAIEIASQGGKKKKRADRPRTKDYRVHYFVLDRDRPLLYERINKRVDQMLEEGLLEEVSGLYKTYGEVAPLRTIGYKEAIAYFKGDMDLDEAIGKIKQHSRNYAKRQLTWFRREEDVTWVQVQEGEDPKETATRIIDLLGDERDQDERS